MFSPFFSSRRRKAERKLDQWRVVINNLQESGVAEDGFNGPSVDINKYSCSSASAASLHSLRKGGGPRRGKKARNNYEDDAQGRNLLSPVMLDDEDIYDTQKNYPSVFNYDTEIYRPAMSVGSRRSSRIGRYSLARSRDSEIDERDDEGFREPQKLNCRRHRRSKSGVWDNRINQARAAVYAQETLCSPVRQHEERRLVITRSAPDLLEMLPITDITTPCYEDSDDSSWEAGGGGLRMNNTMPLMVIASPPRRHRNTMGRSATLNAMRGPPGTPSKQRMPGKIRC